MIGLVTRSAASSSRYNSMRRLWKLAHGPFTTIRSGRTILERTRRTCATTGTTTTTAEQKTSATTKTENSAPHLLVKEKRLKHTIFAFYFKGAIKKAEYLITPKYKQPIHTLKLESQTGYGEVM